MLEWKIESIELPLKYIWRLSRNETSLKTNLLVYVTDGVYKGVGEAAPNIRYGETPEKLIQAFHEWTFSTEKEQSPEAMEKIIQSAIAFPALQMAISSAYFHWYCLKKNQSPEKGLGLSLSKTTETSYTIPLLPKEDMLVFVETHQLQKFSIIKIKVNASQALELIEHAWSLLQKPLMVDANEAWTSPDEFYLFLQELEKTKIPIVFIEQPFPAKSTEEQALKDIKTKSPFPLFADESILNNPNFENLSKMYHGVNVKLMKAGGYFKGKYLLEEARKWQLKTMIGCMVETSIGITGGFWLQSLCDYVDLDGMLFLQNEPFHWLQLKEGALHKDIAYPFLS